MTKKYTANPKLSEKIPVVNYYEKKLSELSSNWNTLNLLNQVNEGGASIENTQKEFSKLTYSLVDNLTNESLKQLSNEINSKSQVVVDVLISELFIVSSSILKLISIPFTSFIAYFVEICSQQRNVCFVFLSYLVYLYIYLLLTLYLL